jgi:Repeat of unknown function (DUF346)
MSVPNQQHVFYRGTDGHIHHILWDTFSAKLYADVWTRHAPPAAGDPATLATPGQQHVFYRGQDRHIHHIVWVAEKRRLYRDVWTLRTGAPLAAGDPVTMETPGQQHVFYRGTDGAINHILWASPSPRTLYHDDWRARAGAPAATGDPATMVTAEGQQHVFYRGVGGEINHIFLLPPRNCASMIGRSEPTPPWLQAISPRWRPSVSNTFSIAGRTVRSIISSGHPYQAGCTMTTGQPGRMRRRLRVIPRRW